MFETSIFLLAAAFAALPSLISSKTDKGRRVLGTAVFVQGAYGLFLTVWMGAGVFGVLFTSRELLVETNGVIFWIFLFLARVLALAAGCIFVFTFSQRLLMFSRHEDFREKCSAMFFRFVSFQTSVGFLCLVMGIWNILYETYVFPVLKY